MSEFDDEEENDDEENWTNLKQAAVALHEMFVTLTDSGFNESQGLKIIAHLIEGAREEE